LISYIRVHDGGKPPYILGADSDTKLVVEASPPGRWALGKPASEVREVIVGCGNRIEVLDADSQEYLQKRSQRAAERKIMAEKRAHGLAARHNTKERRPR
jgi:hypothetical protein